MSEYEQYEALQARMKRARELGYTELYQVLWRQLEALKNKHGGHIPKPEALAK